MLTEAPDTKAKPGRPTATVVISAYTLRRLDDILAAVGSVLEQDPPPDQVIVVVDHNDELLDRLDELRPVVDVLANTGTRGLSGARNTGVRAASGDVVIFMDDDARAQPGWLAATLAAYQREHVLGVAGFVAPLWSGSPPRWLAPEFYWVVGCSYNGLPPAGQAVRNPIGANMSFRRTVFERVGGFTEGVGRSEAVALPLGCEETELGIRVGSAFPGSVILHVPAAAVRHRVDASRTTWRYFLSRCYAEGLSKAAVAALVGAQDALLSERSYVRRTLPAGAAREIGGLLRRGDLDAVARLASIVIGTVVTAAGYAAGLQHRRRRMSGPAVTAAGPARRVPAETPLQAVSARRGE